MLPNQFKVNIIKFKDSRYDTPTLTSYVTTCEILQINFNARQEARASGTLRVYSLLITTGKDDDDDRADSERERLATVASY